MTRRSLVLGLIVLGGMLGLAVAQQPPLGKIEKLKDNLYRIPGQGGATAVYVHGNGVVLVDTKLANNGQGILDQVRTVTDKPISMVVEEAVTVTLDAIARDAGYSPAPEFAID